MPTVQVAPAVPTSAPVVVPTVASTPTTDPFLLIGPPVRVRIPSIGVDAAVELVGLTSDHAMDVPKSWSNVGWYRDGYRPGEPGNAVLAGHLDTSSGGPAVFWSLDKVQPGDEVVVDYANGDRYTFAVEGQETYDYNAQGPIIDRIFGESLTADLNLVTCDGAWDHGMATYTHRLVVFATLVPEKTVGTGAGRANPLP
jgi:sortase (surface protein transpeptidase)